MVNIELDMIGKYVARLLGKGKALSEDSLRDLGMI
jgi:riboflavin synthase alpha subunit